jgi:hypothetical protein
MSYNPDEPCLSFVFNQPPDPTSPFADNAYGPTPAYTCRRCGETFSDRNPTIMTGLKESCDSYADGVGKLVVN